MGRFFQSRKSAFAHSRARTHTFARYAGGDGCRARRHLLIRSNSPHTDWRATRTNFRPSVDPPIDGRQFVGQLCCILLPSMPKKGLVGFYASSGASRDGNDGLSLRNISVHSEFTDDASYWLCWSPDFPLVPPVSQSFILCLGHVTRLSKLSDCGTHYPTFCLSIRTL